LSRNFLQITEKSKIACLNSKQQVSDHFVDVSKMVTPGLGDADECKERLIEEIEGRLRQKAKADLKSIS